MVCACRQNPQMWRASVSFSLEFDFQKRAHTLSLRWLAYTISEMVGIHHLWVRWQVPFSRNPFHPFPYFWRQILLKDRFQHSGVCRFYTQTIFLQFTRIICLDIHFKHTHTRTQKTECSIAVWFVCRFFSPTIWVIPNNMWPPRSSPIHSRLFCCPQNRALEPEWSCFVQNYCKGHIQSDYWKDW